MTSPKTEKRLHRLLAMLPWVIAHPSARVDEVCVHLADPHGDREHVCDLGRRKGMNLLDVLIGEIDDGLL